VRALSTTATVALFDGEKVTFGTGDSRAYLFRDGEIARSRTTPSSEPDRRGRITRKVRTHPHRNLILKAIDKCTTSTPTCSRSRPVGDRLLFCSDGASVLDDGRLADILSMGTPDYAAVEVVRASLEAAPRQRHLHRGRRRRGRRLPTTSSRCWSVPADLKRGAPPSVTGLFRATGPTRSSSRSAPRFPTLLAIETDPVDPERRARLRARRFL
jgi:protein phosphatase